MWNGASVQSCGTTRLLVANPVGYTRHKVKFHVVSGNHKPLLGLTDVLKMNLVTVNLDIFERVLAINLTRDGDLPDARNLMVGFDPAM